MSTSKLQIEMVTTHEAGRLLQRDMKKYGGVVVGLYGAGLTRNVSFADAGLLRAAYFFCTIP